MRFKVLVLSLRRNRKKFRRYSYGFVLYFVNCRAAHAREGIDQRKIKMEGREGKIKVLSQPVVPSVARYRDDQLYQRLRLYANGRRLISIMSINLFLSFFSPRKKKKGDRQRQRQRQREREREREREILGVSCSQQGGIERRAARKRTRILLSIRCIFRDTVK